MLASDYQTITIAAYRSGGSSSTQTASVTEIKSRETVTAANFARLVSGGKPLTVAGDNGTNMVFDTDALKGISSQALGDIKVEIKDVSEEHQESLPDKMILSLTVSSGRNAISNFGGKVTISLPYELKEGERAEDVTVWHLAGDGTMTEIPCAYDPVSKLATFNVTHLSLYVVGVADKKPWINPFTDVSKTDWFYSAVEFANRNALFAGTGAAPGQGRLRTGSCYFATLIEGRLK